jgi:tetratricopeptide (TPR) repeat protein
MEAAEAFARAWKRSVAEDAPVAYQLGLAWRLHDDDDKARGLLDRAIALDPDYAAARYDRGEVLLAAGELDAAEQDFLAVVRLAPDQWAGHFRLADVAARRHQPDAFGAHLLDALRFGFTLRTVAQDRRWRGYLADPELGPVLRRLAVVYQDESVLDAFTAP